MRPPARSSWAPPFGPKMMLILLMVSCGIKAGEIYRAPGGRRREKGRRSPRSGHPQTGAMIVMLVAGGRVLMDIIGFRPGQFPLPALLHAHCRLRGKGSLTSDLGIGDDLSPLPFREGRLSPPAQGPVVFRRPDHFSLPDSVHHLKARVTSRGKDIHGRSICLLLGTGLVNTFDPLNFSMILVGTGHRGSGRGAPGHYHAQRHRPGFALHLPDGDRSFPAAHDLGLLRGGFRGVDHRDSLQYPRRPHECARRPGKDTS